MYVPFSTLKFTNAWPIAPLSCRICSKVKEIKRSWVTAAFTLLEVIPRTKHVRRFLFVNVKVSYHYEIVSCAIPRTVLSFAQMKREIILHVLYCMTSSIKSLTINNQFINSQIVFVRKVHEWSRLDFASQCW